MEKFFLLFLTFYFVNCQESFRINRPFATSNCTGNPLPYAYYSIISSSACSSLGVCLGYGDSSTLVYCADDLDEFEGNVFVESFNGTECDASTLVYGYTVQAICLGSGNNYNLATCEDNLVTYYLGCSDPSCTTNCEKVVHEICAANEESSTSAKYYCSSSGGSGGGSNDGSDGDDENGSNGIAAYLSMILIFVALVFCY
jgi:hypothetical protein